MFLVNLQMPSPKIYLIDVSGLCYRAYYAIGGLSTSYGQPTGAVFGFTNILNKILKDKPEYAACCFDVSRDTFRQRKYSDYKIQRPTMPDELAVQMSLVKDIVSCYNISIYEKKGYEADDLIASLARKADKKGIEVIIVSSDKDILQLVSENIKVLDPKKDKTGIIYDQKQVEIRFGLAPSRIVDMISLMGDSSDNIPGAKGIGEKTAVSLLKEFGSVANLTKNVSKIKSERMKQIIKDNIDSINLSYDLALLKDDLDVDFDLEKLKLRNPDYDRMFSLFKRLEFNSFIKNLPTESRELKEAENFKASSFKSNKQKEEAFDLLKDKKEFIFVLSQEQKPKVFFELEGLIYSVDIDDPYLIKIIENPSIKKISHNLKDTKISLSKEGIELRGLGFDTMLAAYLLNPAASSFSLEDLAMGYLDQRPATEGLNPQACLDAILKLIPILKQKLKTNSLDKLLYDLELPLIDVLVSMHLNGVAIDSDALNSMSKTLEKRLIDLRAGIYSVNNNEEFNLNSPKQLAVVLFEKLNLPVIKKTKTGPSTDEEVLRRLSSVHELPLLILEFRQLMKLKSTYIDALPSLIDKKTGRIHATFDQAGTETGRLSSNNPNLQNIPIKSDIASLIRKAFIAKSGNRLISADYSQIELRVLAHFSGDEALSSAFKEGLDVHRHTASLIFQVEEDKVTDGMRETAKRINFGIVYGMSSFGLAKDLAISQQEAKGFIDAYFLRYPKVKTYIDAQIRLAKKNGFVTTILGRRRYLPEIDNKNNAIRSFAERQAVNSPIQGSAADIIKLAMINIYETLKERSLKTMMIMQIHDELVFEAANDEIKEAIDLIRDKMENVLKLNVALRVNIKQGQNWLEAETVS